MRRRIWFIALALLLITIVVWISWSVVYTIPEIQVGMTEPEVEARLGKPDIRRQEEGHSGFALYHAVPRWLLGRHDVYIVTYDLEGHVASYDLFENNFSGARRTHR